MRWSWKKDAVKQSIPLGLCSYVMPQAINFARYLPAWVQLRVMAVWKPLIPLLAFSCQGVLQGWMTSKCHVCDNSMGVTSVWYWWGQACQQHPSLRPNDLPRRRLIFFFFPGLAVLVWVSRGPELFGPEVVSWLLGFLSRLFPTVSQRLLSWQRMSFRTWKLFETALSVSRHYADCIMLQMFQRKHFFIRNS